MEQSRYLRSGDQAGDWLCVDTGCEVLGCYSLKTPRKHVAGQRHPEPAAARMSGLWPPERKSESGKLVLWFPLQGESEKGTGGSLRPSLGLRELSRHKNQHSGWFLKKVENTFIFSPNFIEAQLTKL